jgi:hypothetical protein
VYGDVDIGATLLNRLHYRSAVEPAAGRHLRGGKDVVTDLQFTEDVPCRLDQRRQQVCLVAGPLCLGMQDDLRAVINDG